MVWSSFILSVSINSEFSEFSEISEFSELSEPSEFSDSSEISENVKNIEASFLFLAHLFVYLQGVLLMNL
jgi:hypothetical protein